eukprot:1143603-Pelagomonas_calceolata.AAC.1
MQRPAVREGIVFIARTIVQRTQPGQRQTVKTEEYFCHVYVKADSNLAGIVVADSQALIFLTGPTACFHLTYPTTASFSVIHKVMDEFVEQGRVNVQIYMWSAPAEARVHMASQVHKCAVVCGCAWFANQDEGPPCNPPLPSYKHMTHSSGRRASL